MSRLTPLHWKKLEGVILRDGFVLARQSASHRIYTKPGIARPIVIPTYENVGKDIISNIIRTSGMSKEKFFRLLKKC